MGKFLIAELIGVSGVGKSSIFNKLLEKEGTKLAKSIFETNSLKFKRSLLQTFLINPIFFLRLLFFNLTFNKKQFIGNRKPFKIILVTWTKLRLFTQSSISVEKDIHLFDEGPLFWIAALLVYTPNGLKMEINSHLEEVLDQKSIKSIFPIYLHCDSNILIERVVQRGRGYLRNLSVEDAMQFIDEYELAFEKIMQNQNGENQIEVSTSSFSIDQAADSVYLELKQIFHF